MKCQLFIANKREICDSSILSINRIELIVLLI